MRNPSDLPPRRPRNPGGGFRVARPSRGRLLVTLVVGIIVAVVISGRSIASFYVDVLWHDSVGRTDVFWGILLTRAGLGAAFIAVFAGLLIMNMWLADRLAPEFVPISPEERALAGYRDLIGSRQWLLRIVIGVVLGFMVGLPAVTQWQEWMLFSNHQPFGIDDPLFGQDVSFYVFRLPFAGFVVNWLFGALVLIAIVVAATHFLNGGIRLQNVGRRVTPQAKAHLSVLFAALAVVRAAGYWLSRFGLTASSRGVVQGATYTDVNAQLPAINLMILVSLAVALLFLWNVRLKGWRIPVMASLMWIVIAVAAGTIYPAIVQRFSVQPNVSTKELPFIERNLEATKNAVGMNEIETVPVDFGAITARDIAENEAPLRDVRQLDPTEMRDRFALDRGLTSFYAIRDLDVDRYPIDGRVQQVMVAARELNTAGIPNRTWVSRHLIYTHGCGIVAASASTVTLDGRPTYVDLGEDRPQMYIGDQIGDYAVLGTEQNEQACPGVEQGLYEGEGGVELSSVIRRAAFALNFGEYNLFGSGLITPESRILWVRNVRERAEKIAPFLRYDADPYPAVVDGRIVWILDAFTTTDRYPYAQRANTAQLTPGSGLNTSFNYVRNSVKVVMDAYDANPVFYVVDDKDPIIATWGKVFPNLFTPVSEAPEELVSHFRYPEDLFRVQTNMYGRYQFDDAELFFNRDAAWSVAQASSTEPEGGTGFVGSTGTVGAAEAIDVDDANVLRFEPYFTLFHSPTNTSGVGEFSMLRPFVPFSSDDARKELRAFMVVSSEPGSYGKLRVYSVAAPLPEGPATVAAEFGSDPTVAQQVTLLDQRGSRVVYGDIQLVPVGKGLLYVRPLYVRPDDPNARQVFVRKFLAFYDNRTVIADSLGAAIRTMFAGYTGDIGDRVDDGIIEEPENEVVTDTGGETATPTTTTLPVISGSNDPVELLAVAEQLFAEADAALAQTPPNFTEYQQKTQRARALVAQAVALLGQ